MSNIVKTDGGSLASLLHGKGGGLTIPKPYERDIFLFDTFIAGTTHIEGIEELAQYLNVNDKLDFYREPHNRFDPQAIVIKNSNGVKIGYVPREDNVVFSRLMDAGKLLFGKITAKETKGKGIKIKIGIYLHE